MVLSACGDGPAPPQLPERSLDFVAEPTRTPVNVAITPAPQVAILDESGQPDPAATVAVTVGLAGLTSPSALTGTTVVNAVAGVAVFADLRLDRPGTFTLVASAPNATGATSASFRVFPPYAQIAAGGGHSCATTAAGVAYCWGRNITGQLGIGTTTPNWAIPQEVRAPTGIGFAAVAAGGFHTCTVTPSGAAYCWGDNVFNQLGDGTNETRTTPVLVSAPAEVSFTELTVGYWHSCALTSAGAAYCWGLNVEGALGDGTTTTPSTPVAVATPGGAAFADVSAGGGHTCGVTPTGAAYCWGENPYGGLGDGTTEPKATPVLVAAPAGVSFVLVSAGDEHSCGLTAAGAAYCWGRNDVGQLGDGTTASRLTPVLVTAPTGVSFATIDAGALRTCGVAPSGATYCWGLNDLRGLLGDGTTINRTTPVLVVMPEGASFAAVDVALEHTCALTAAGAAYCWGYNGFGQLGDGTGLTRMTPVPVEQ